MHRPAVRDLDVRMQPALKAAPELVGPLEAVKRPLARGDWAEARLALDDLDAALRAAGQRGDILDDVRDALSPDAYWRQRAWKKVLVIFAGPGTNLLFAVLIFAVLFMAGGGKATATIDEVVPNTPAARMGLQNGDRVLSIGGRPVNQGKDIPALVSGSNGRPLRVQVQRDGRLVTLGPARAEESDGVYRLGFVLRGRGLAPPEAIKESVRTTAIVSREIVTSLGNLVHKQGREEISSPVGIVQGSSTAASRGAENYLWVLGLISLSLALLNLLPLLPLDGGHIFFSILEGVRGRAVAREVYERVSAIGIAVVLMLFFIGLSNDVGRIGGG